MPNPSSAVYRNDVGYFVMPTRKVIRIAAKVISFLCIGAIPLKLFFLRGL